MPEIQVSHNQIGQPMHKNCRQKDTAEYTIEQLNVMVITQHIHKGVESGEKKRKL